MVESWELDEANLDAPLLHGSLIQVLANSVHKTTAELTDVSGLWDSNEK